MALEHTKHKEKAEATGAHSAHSDRLHSELHQAEKSHQKPVHKPDVASKEEALFKKTNAFAKPVESEGKTKNAKDEHGASSKEKAESGKHRNGKEEPSVLDLSVTIERKKPVQGSKAGQHRDAVTNSESKTNGQQLIDSAKQYWNEAAKDGAAKGGVVGHVEAAAARVMGKGAEAAKVAHDAYTSFAPDGAISQAREYWQDVATDGAKEGGAWGTTKHVSGAVAEGLLELSGLGNVENGATKLAKDLKEGAPEEEVNKDLKSLGIDTALAALTFVPALNGVKAMGKGEGLYRTAAAGSEIAGMAVTDAKLAGTVSQKLTAAISETMPAGEKLSKASIQNFVGRMEQIGSEYGIKLKQGGIVGESNGTIDAIEYSTKAGGKHEVVHAMQQLQSRAVALEGHAAKLGKSVDELTQVDRADAFKAVVKPFEDVAYNQHEMFAGAAHSWGRTATNYADILKSNVSSFDKALSSGTVPDAGVKLSSKLYGELPNLLGRSQLAIGKNLSSPAALFLNNNRDWKDSI